MNLVIFSGPPSSGKTSVILKTIESMKQRGIKAGVVKFDCLYTDDDVLKIRKDFFHNKKNIFSTALLILLSLSGIYYTFFSCFFMIVIFLIKVNRHNIKQLLKKFVLSFSIIGITMFLAYIPAILYKLKVGLNEERPLRHVSETEFYALRISRLFISQKLFYLKGEYFEKIQKIR